MGIGDVISQQAVEKKGFQNHDFTRTFRMGCIGLCIGPVLRSWYLTLERFIKPTSRPIVDGLKKMVADQVLFSPCITAAFFWINNSFSGGTFEELKEKLKKRYIETQLTSYKLWPAVQVVNFTVVPFQYRVALVQLVAVFWNAYLSWQVNKPGAVEMEEIEKKNLV